MFPKRFDTLASLLLAGAVFSIPTVALAAHHGHAAANVDIIDSQGQSTGKATLTQHADGVHLEVVAERIPAGVHAVHVHTTGTCTGPDFTSAGGHWNPAKKQHGHDNPAGAHMGDLPNMTAGADGKGTLKTVIKAAMIRGGESPLIDADGAAVVIHAAADDYKTDPTGNAGGRIACGIVKAR